MRNRKATDRRSPPGTAPACGPPTASPQWRLGLGLNYRGEQNPEGARHVTAKAFTTVDAMAEYTIDASQSLKLNVSNLSDELYSDSLYRGFYAPGAARQVQLSYKVLF